MIVENKLRVFLQRGRIGSFENCAQSYFHLFHGEPHANRITRTQPKRQIGILIWFHFIHFTHYCPCFVF